MTHILKLTLFATLLLGLCACGQTQVSAEDDVPEQAPATREVDPEVIADPSHEQMTRTAPDTFKALFHTSAGDFTVEVTREWAPGGADRFYNLVDSGYYDGNRFFRIVPGFVAQWGLHGDPDVNKAWIESEHAQIEDDPIRQSNTRGMITFANAGPDTRSAQVFINFSDNTPLDDPRRMRGSVFAPFGEVVGDGMDVVDALFDEYPNLDGRRYRDPATAISQGHLMEHGNAYLEEYFPNLDYIITATIVEDE